VVDAADFDDTASELVDGYLAFLRGRGPEPDLGALSADQRRRITEQIAIVSALADRAPALPPLEQDPVAIRLGLVTGSSLPADGANPVEAVLRQLELRFDGQVALDFAPSWQHWQSAQMSALAQCSALGNTVAVFGAPDGLPAGEPAGVAFFLRYYPDVSAVCLTSPDAQDAVLLTAADVNASVDPARGWLEPGVHAPAAPLEVVLGRYFEARLPRWERVVGLGELIELGDVSADATAVATGTLAQARRARPRLPHRRAAVASLKSLEPADLAGLMVDVQAGRLSGDALLSRLSALSEAIAS